LEAENRELRIETKDAEVQTQRLSVTLATLEEKSARIGRFMKAD